MDFSFRRKRRRRIRGELEEELALRRHLLDIGDRLGAASASATSDIFPLLAERLSSVVPIKSLTIWMVDHAVQRIRALYHSEREVRSEEHTSELPSHHEIVCRLLLEKKKKKTKKKTTKKKKKKKNKKKPTHH